MQDGLFRGQAQDYRVGRSIFLFSGGTAESFEAFQSNLDGTMDAREKETRAQVKLTDFLSRLRGHLDLLDINETGEWEDVVKIRRAMLLRSLLEKHAKEILRTAPGMVEGRASIQSDVVRRFVNEWKYLHGVRSMQAVIQSSRWIDGQFVLASLPADKQLNAHVAKWR